MPVSSKIVANHESGADSQEETEPVYGKLTK